MSSIISASEAVLDRTRFESLWKRCSPLDATNSMMQIWEDLIKRYTEHHRYYHNKKHLAFCLQQLDLAASFVEDVDAVEMAIWFHDVVYKSAAPDNEEKSAALFEKLVKPHFSPDFVAKICEIIIATKHNNAPNNDNEAYMLDIDLSSLGLPWEYFYQDSNDLRAELSGISDKRFYSEKLKFFNVLLDRPRIFYSEFFSTRYEVRAKENILRYTSWIKAKQYR